MPLREREGPAGHLQAAHAIVRKIRKYRRPLIVITGVPPVPTPDFFALDEAMYGTHMVVFTSGSGETTEKRGGGLMVVRGEDGALIREHLLGVLGVRVEMPMGAIRHRVRLHLFHARAGQSGLA